MTSTVSERPSLIHEFITRCKECPYDPDSGRLLKIFQNILDESTLSATWKNIEKRGGINFPTIEEAISALTSKPGGVLIYADKRYSYFQNVKDFEIYCQLHTRPRDYNGVSHYYFVPLSQKRNVAIIFDGEEPDEYKKLWVYLKEHLKIDPWDVQIIPATGEKRSDIILTNKVGTKTENEQLLMAFKNYVRSQDKQFSYLINNPEIYGDEKIGEYIRLALSHRVYDSKTNSIDDLHPRPNIVINFSQITTGPVTNTGTMLIGNGSASTDSTTAGEAKFDFDTWIKNNDPNGKSTVDYYHDYLRAAGNAASRKSKFAAAISARGYFAEKSGDRRRPTWLKKSTKA